MDEYRVVILMACIALMPFIGYAIIQLKNLLLGRTLAWVLVVVSIVAVERFSLSDPPIIRMLLIITALLFGMKTVVGVESRHSNGNSNQPMPLRNWMAFVTLWFGMRPRLFAKFSGQPRDDWARYVIRGLVRIAIGAALFVTAWVLIHGLSLDGLYASNSGPEILQTAPWRRWSATICLMVGFSMLVHFGLFSVLVGFWRRLSLNCGLLFRAPMLSTSLTEFWGRRWNLAFSEMTTLAVFRPIKSWLGKNPAGRSTATVIATVLAFLFSGLLHELAISVPVRAGFGSPMIYFALHGLAMYFESRMNRDGNSILQRPWIGRVWTWLWILLPLPLLFHRAFLEGCVWPLISR